MDEPPGLVRQRSGQVHKDTPASATEARIHSSRGWERLGGETCCWAGCRWAVEQVPGTRAQAEVELAAHHLKTHSGTWFLTKGFQARRVSAAITGHRCCCCHHQLSLPFPFPPFVRLALSSLCISVVLPSPSLFFFPALSLSLPHSALTLLPWPRPGPPLPASLPSPSLLAQQSFLFWQDRLYSAHIEMSSVASKMPFAENCPNQNPIQQHVLQIVTMSSLLFYLEESFLMTLPVWNKLSLLSCRTSCILDLSAQCLMMSFILFL